MHAGIYDAFQQQQHAFQQQQQSNNVYNMLTRGVPTQQLPQFQPQQPFSAFQQGQQHPGFP